jgi:predicted TIM-barrel fold metal-dependent hydrolase
MEYVRDHFRWASQPIEESARPEQIAKLLDDADAADLLLFSSDYPHYDYDHPERALPRSLDARTRRRILVENAREFYGLPTSRPADRFDHVVA